MGCTNSVIFGTFFVILAPNPGIVRKITVISRTNSVIFRTNAVLFIIIQFKVRTNPFILRTISAYFVFVLLLCIIINDLTISFKHRAMSKRIYLSSSNFN